MTIDEIGVSSPRRVRNVGRVHAHGTPVKAILQALVSARETASQGLPLIVEMPGMHLHSLEIRFGRDRAMLGKFDHMITVELNAFVHSGITPAWILMANVLIKPGQSILTVE